MLNIISNEIFKPNWVVNGQTKVFRNLIKGLDKINYPYVLNKKHDYCDKLWIYNDESAVRYLSKIDTKKIKVLFGPDISLFSLLNGKIDKRIVKDCVALQPSKWSKDMLVQLGFNACKLDIWPVGIDTDSFIPSSETKDRIIIYFKRRFDNELSVIIQALKKNNIKYSLIKYGEYKEIDYQNELKKARYIIWLGQSESQGIALEEALASNVPILVWEISCLGHWKASTTKEQNSIPQEWLSIKASVAPYFNSDCGYIINNEKEIDDGIDFMEKNLNMFNPRKYILDDLFLEKQAREFVGLFDKYWKSDSMSMNQKVINDQASWKNRFTWCLMLKIFYFLKI